MTKRVFLFVLGDDYSAMDFSKHFKPQEVYEDMINCSIKEQVLEGDDYFIEVRILEFGEIDDKFISFVWDAFVDYDVAKSRDIFEVKPMEL